LACAGCASTPENPRTLAAAARLSYDEAQYGAFRLASFARREKPGGDVVVYIEGDGHAFTATGQPTTDPTPRDPVGLRLAMLDPSPNVLYLARPCQFVRNDMMCRPAYWTERRFSEEVVDSLNRALDAWQLGSFRSGRVHLVGYSGGGALAALIAARRDDVASLRTVAGNLDPSLAAYFKKVPPLAGSLDPRTVAPRLAALPQVHWIGGKDNVIPAAIARSFLKALGSDSCAALYPVPEASHATGWYEAWAEQARRLPTCRGAAEDTGG
jgi:pimeloyl-ACP methyl ester carboxylesterase